MDTDTVKAANTQHPVKGVLSIYYACTTIQLIYFFGSTPADAPFDHLPPVICICLMSIFLLKKMLSFSNYLMMLAGIILITSIFHIGFTLADAYLPLMKEVQVNGFYLIWFIEQFSLILYIATPCLLMFSFLKKPILITHIIASSILLILFLIKFALSFFMALHVIKSLQENSISSSNLTWVHVSLSFYFSMYLLCFAAIFLLAPIFKDFRMQFKTPNVDESLVHD